MHRSSGPLAAGVAIACLTMAAGCARSGDGPTVQVRIPPGSSFAAAADSLAQAGLVQSVGWFRAYARLKGVDQRIRPGTYGFRIGDNWTKILEDLEAGRILTFRLVIPEGWELHRIATRVAAHLELDADSVVDVLGDPELADRWDLPGPSLEGYLFPATYTLPVDISLDSVVAIMVTRYRGVWTPARSARADSIGMDEREVLTLASIIEKEARRSEEMPLISAVFHNRLRRGYPLQADATVQYLLPERQSRLLFPHIRDVADNPYNTYHHRGLPPGPIASPGEAAIDAALEPADVDYMYFVARPDGTHIFTRTNAEHNAARARVRPLWDAARRAGGSGGN